MLKTRIFTALAMALVFLVALFYSPWVIFAGLTGAVLLFAAWEWGNLSGFASRAKRALYALAALIVALLAAWVTDWVEEAELVKAILMFSCSWWALALLWVQGFPSSALIWGSSAVRALMGLCVLVPAWLALLYLRNEPAGALLVLFVVLLVSSADIGAYFSGRAFGRRKLAPNVSPGKSWEGVAGGVVSALVLGTVFNFLVGGEHWFALLLVVIPTALVSVLGDLLESMVKRHRGIKDSGSILPGHGGVLDRVDGLTAALPVFTLAVMLSTWRI